MSDIISFQLLGPTPRKRPTADRLLALHDQAQQVIRAIDETMLNARMARMARRTEQRSAAPPAAAQKRPRGPIEYHSAGSVLSVR